MAVIRAASEKLNRRKAIRAKLAAGALRVRRYVDEEDKPQRKKFDAMIDKMDEKWWARKDSNLRPMDYESQTKLRRLH